MHYLTAKFMTSMIDKLIDLKKVIIRKFMNTNKLSRESGVLT